MDQVMDDTDEKKKRGGVNPIVTVEMLQKLRPRVLELISKYPSPTQLSKALLPEYPGLSWGTFSGYVSAVLKTTDYVFELYTAKKIPISVFYEIAIAGYDKATQDFFAQKVLERKMSQSQVNTVKVLLKKGESMFTAIQKACGDIPLYQAKLAKEAAKAVKSFENIVDDIGKKSQELRALISMAVEIAPITSLDKGKLHYAIFHKAYLLRHILKEQYEFIDKRVQQYLDELVNFVNTEQELGARRQDEQQAHRDAIQEDGGLEGLEKGGIDGDGAGQPQDEA